MTSHRALATAFAFTLCLACNSAIASEVLSTKIVGVLAGEVYGNLVFIEVSTKASSLPGCQNNRLDYVFDSTTAAGKVSLSMALTAYASGKSVYISGSGACSHWASVESTRHIMLIE